MPGISFGKDEGRTISMGIGTLASNSEDLLITGVPTKFYTPNTSPSGMTHARIAGNMTDYVVENGEQGDWQWRIGASGKKEVWLYRRITTPTSDGGGAGQTVTQNASTYNGRSAIWRYATEIGDFPITFNAAPKVYAYSLGSPDSAANAPWTFFPISILNTTATAGGRAYYCRYNYAPGVVLQLAVYWVGDD